MKALKIFMMAFAATALIAMAPIANQTNNTDHNHHNIVEVASDTDNLSTLVAAVQAAGLVETLSGEGPFTVFAPTNTVKGPSPDRVSTRPAACTAATSVDRLSVSDATSTILW